jgi:hypothetical protein
MGSTTSGWYRGAKPRCENHVVLDARELDPDEHVSWAIARRGHIIRFSVDGNGVRIASNERDDYAPFHYMSTQYGKRKYLGCPQCDRRCRFLYAVGERCACRFCLNLGYQSQLLGVRGRLFWRILKLRQRVNPNASTNLTAAFPKRPKHMRWHRYGELLSRDNALRVALFNGLKDDTRLSR